MTEITVSKLLEFGSDSLKLKVLAGENFLDRKINETAMNRPGLALTGFFTYFANQRLQIFGLAELTYIKNLNSKDRQYRLEEVFKKKYSRDCINPKKKSHS